jgi:hypothetical protein
MGNFLVGAAVWAMIGAIVGMAIGSPKGRRDTGLWLGLLLGPVGWIIVAVMEPNPEVEAARIASIASFQANLNIRDSAPEPIARENSSQLNQAKIDALTKIAELLDKGILSQDEFLDQKKRILGI